MKPEKPLKHEKKATNSQKRVKKDNAASVKLITRGRPPVHEESWTKATTVLFDTQIHWLDMLAANIRLKTRKSISRAELIRAFISATIESGLDLSQVSSEEEIKQILLKKLTA